MRDLKYTGRVTGIGTGKIPDPLDQIEIETVYNIVDVNIPILGKDDKNVRLYIKDDVPLSDGELVDLEVVQSMGSIDKVKNIETSKGTLKVRDYDFL